MRLKNLCGFINNCYARGSVNAGYGYAGGLVGDMSSGYIGNSYSTGQANTGSDLGGLVGHNGGTVTACFWDNETSGLSTSDGGEGKTTAEMKTKATFTDAGWDFTTIWNITENTTYPLFIVPVTTNPPVPALAEGQVGRADALAGYQRACRAD